MTTTASERTIFGDESGTDGRAITDSDLNANGRAITDSDLNAISKNCTRRAWEIPGYADLLAFDQMGYLSDNSYTGLFQGGTTHIDGRLSGVFTRGGGLAPGAADVLKSQVTAGFIGVWKQTSPLTAPSANGVPNMLWAWITGGDQITHTGAGTSNKRWDIVCATVVEANTAPVFRDFEDSVSGDKTSESLVVSRTITVSLQKHEGVPTTGTPSMPEVPAGENVVYAVLIHDDAIFEVVDLTIPVGSMRKSIVPAVRGLFSDTNWLKTPGTSGSITSQSLGTAEVACLLPPDDVAGNGEVRVLGVRIGYQMASGGTIQMIRRYLDGSGTSDVVLETLTITADGSHHAVQADFRPAMGVAPDYLAYWGHGGHVKSGPLQGATLAILVTTPPGGSAGGNIINSVEWYYVG